MTAVRFFEDKGKLTGFAVDGHSTVSKADDEGRLVCAAVSSAAYMTVNTITDIIKAEVNVDVAEAKMTVRLLSKLDECQTMLNGFYIHVEQLSEQYPGNLKIITEV